MSDEVRAVVALGANLGDRNQTLARAVEEIRALAGVRVVAVSDVIETVAQTMVGPDPDAPRYLNGVVLLETTLSPEQLLAAKGSTPWPEQSLAETVEREVVAATTIVFWTPTCPFASSSSSSAS